MKHAHPAHGAPGGGSAILLGSMLGAIGSPGYAAYCASKGALVNLAKQAAIEHAPDGVRVNVVSPERVRDRPVPRRWSRRRPIPRRSSAMVAERTPMGRLGTGRRRRARRSCSSPATVGYISGTVVPLDGGLAARRM